MGDPMDDIAKDQDELTDYDDECSMGNIPSPDKRRCCPDWKYHEGICPYQSDTTGEHGK